MGGRTTSRYVRKQTCDIRKRKLMGNARQGQGDVMRRSARRVREREDDAQNKNAKHHGSASAQKESNLMKSKKRSTVEMKQATHEKQAKQDIIPDPKPKTCTNRVSTLGLAHDRIASRVCPVVVRYFEWRSGWRRHGFRCDRCRTRRGRRCGGNVP